MPLAAHSIDVNLPCLSPPQHTQHLAIPPRRSTEEPFTSSPLERAPSSHTALLTAPATTLPKTPISDTPDSDTNRGEIKHLTVRLPLYRTRRYGLFLLPYCAREEVAVRALSCSRHCPSQCPLKTNRLTRVILRKQSDSLLWQSRLATMW